MDRLPDPQEAAARARAAMHYAGFTYDLLARESGVSRDSLRALMGKSAPRGATLDRLYRIADACGVPRDFMLRGFETRRDTEAAFEDRLQRIESALIGLQAPGFRQRDLEALRDVHHAVSEVEAVRRAESGESEHSSDEGANAREES